MKLSKKHYESTSVDDWEIISDGSAVYEMRNDFYSKTDQGFRETLLDIRQNDRGDFHSILKPINRVDEINEKEENNNVDLSTIRELLSEIKTIEVSNRTSKSIIALYTCCSEDSYLNLETLSSDVYDDDNYTTELLIKYPKSDSPVDMEDLLIKFDFSQSLSENKVLPPAIEWLKESENSDIYGPFLSPILEFNPVWRIYSPIHKCDLNVRILQRNSSDVSRYQQYYEILSYQRSLTQLCHANIEQVVQCVELSNNYTIILLLPDWHKATTIDEFLTRYGQVNEIVAGRWAYQLVSALDYCHSEKIYHRDLRCSNILLGIKLQIKITAFGASWMIGKRFTTGEATLNDMHEKFSLYSCPEAYDGRPNVFNASLADSWSLGVMIYRWTTGFAPCRPWHVNDLLSLSYSGLTYPENVKVTGGCRHILANLLRPERERRTTIETTFKHPWILSFQSLSNAPLINLSPSIDLSTMTSWKKSKSNYENWEKILKDWDLELNMTYKLYNENQKIFLSKDFQDNETLYVKKPLLPIECKDGSQNEWPYHENKECTGNGVDVRKYNMLQLKKDESNETLLCVRDYNN